MAEINTEYIENFRICGQYMYKNQLMLNEHISPENITAVMDMKLEATDVCVATYPKTGTTFLQEILWLLRHNADDEGAKAKNYERVPFVEFTYFDGIKKFYELKHPREFKTHLPYEYLPKQIRDKERKVIYCYRNPKDTLVSYYHFYTCIVGLGFFTGTWHDFFEMYYRVNKGQLNYGCLLKHYKGYWERRHDPNMFITTYEALVQKPYEELTRIAKFVGIAADDKLLGKVIKMTAFDAMKVNPATNYESISADCKFEESPFMRKGKVGDWKNYFTEEQNAKLEAMIEKELGGTGIKFVYE